MSEATITPPRTDMLILRPWRDGSVHAEVATASFHGDDGIMRTHADDRSKRHVFETLCGARYFGRGSVTTWAGPHIIDCEKCRQALLGEV